MPYHSRPAECSKALAAPVTKCSHALEIPLVRLSYRHFGMSKLKTVSLGSEGKVLRKFSLHLN